MVLHDALDYFARETPDAPYASCGDRSLCYGEARSESLRLANALRGAGLEPGDRFAFLAKNCLEYSIVFMAASRVGVVPVPLNYRLAPPELAYIIGDAGSKLLIAAAEYCDGIDSVRGELGSVTRWIAMGGGARPGWEDFSGWVGESEVSDPGLELSADGDLYQMYTSGTTGRPKGAVLTQRAVLSQLMQQLSTVEVSRTDRVLIVAPLYHAAAAITALGTFGSGGSVLIHEDFHPGAVVAALSSDGITRTTLVPAMIQACLVMVPDAAERSYDDLRLIIYGASPIASETLKQAMDVFGCEFMQGYGMTETTAQLTLLTARDHERALREKPELLLSAGRPLPGTQIRIVDENDQPVPTGSIGEIVARGAQLMKGYWNLDEATRETLRGGWLHTGDAGILDDEGFLYIQDRTKDMIVSGGENVYPREVEELLFGHPAVADVAVIGVPDEKFGEAVKAIVVLRAGAEGTAEEIMSFCQGKIAGYKRPRSVEFIDELPRNASGKVLKKDLREKYWAGQSRRVS
jgi:acyl-CoA synthetase (AMP-forming)/AMP-acid ligase II